MKKGWFNNWKMRYVTCTEHTLSLYKVKGDESTAHLFNTIDCNVKRIDAKRWNRKYVFRVKIAKKRIYLAAEDEEALQQWITAIQGRVMRASLLGANALKCAQPVNSSRKRSTSLVPTARSDIQSLSSFQNDSYITAFQKLLSDTTNAEFQYQFSEKCGEFLALAHTHSQQFFNSNQIDKIDGVIAEFVNHSQRRHKLHKMRMFTYVLSLQKPHVYAPLSCIIDYCGKSLYFQTEVQGTDQLSEENSALLDELPLDSSKTKAIQDTQGNLWIIDGVLSSVAHPNPSQEQLQAFINRLDNMQTYVFDSQSLCEYLRQNNVPIKTLPSLAEMSKIPGIRILLQTEIIARTAKKLLSRRYPDIEKKDYNVETVKFFNLILGNDEESKEFWDKTLIPAINKKFKIELNRNIALLHLPQLFFSLQFHTGVDFKDEIDYDFNKSKPLTIAQLNGIFSVPHHFLAELSLNLRKIEDDPYQQICQGYYNQAMLSLNSKISLYQSLYGDENAYVASGLALLSQAYLGLGDTEKADICAKGALSAGRTIHATLIPAYQTMISICEPGDIEKLINESLSIIHFQLGNIHWFNCDIYISAAKAYMNYNMFEPAAKNAQLASEIATPLLGSGHPKTAECILLQGKIRRLMKQYANSRSLIQQALFAMTAAFGARSSQVGECHYELADVTLESGQLEEAEKSSKICLSIREEQFGSDDPLVVETVQQLAIIYDTMGNANEAFKYYLRLFNFLRSFEDESIFEETTKVLRNMIVLFFRTSGGQYRQIVAQLRRKKTEQEAMSIAFKNLMENDPIQILTALMKKYQDTGEPEPFEQLACIYHIGLDDLSNLPFIQSE